MGRFDFQESMREFKQHAEAIFSGGPIPEYSIGPVPFWSPDVGWAPVIDWWEKVAQSFQVTPRQIASLVTPRMISRSFPGVDGLYLLSQDERLKPATSFIDPPAGLVLTCLIRGGDMKRIIEQEVRITSGLIVNDLAFGDLEQTNGFGTGIICIRGSDFVLVKKLEKTGFLLWIHAPKAARLFQRILGVLKRSFRLKVTVPRSTNKSIEVVFL